VGACWGWWVSERAGTNEVDELQHLVIRELMAHCSKAVAFKHVLTFVLSGSQLESIRSLVKATTNMPSIYHPRRHRKFIIALTSFRSVMPLPVQPAPVPQHRSDGPTPVSWHCSTTLTCHLRLTWTCASDMTTWPPAAQALALVRPVCTFGPRGGVRSVKVRTGFCLG
jgi:hypothetical protein